MAQRDGRVVGTVSMRRDRIALSVRNVSIIRVLVLDTGARIRGGPVHDWEAGT